MTSLTASRTNGVRGHDETILRRALIEGNLDGALETIASLEGDQRSVARTLSLGLRFGLNVLGKTGPPDMTEVVELPRDHGPTTSLLALLCSAAQRVAFLSFDLETLEGWLRIHGELQGLSDEGTLRLSIGRAWAEAMRGHVAVAKSALEEVKEEAKAQKVASCLIDAEATWALVLLTEGHIEQAISVARRASRMAAAEELPFQELFAHVVLARVRRMAGAPFLASKILDALTPLAPRLWHPWICWEALLSGMAAPKLQLPPCPAQGASEALAQLLCHARDGNRQGFDDAFVSALDQLSGFSSMAADVTVLAACLDASLDMDDAYPMVKTWSKGSSSEVPKGLHGIVRFGHDADALPTVGFVCARPGRGARRILGAGIPLAQDEETVLIDREKRPRDRTHTALAALALLESQRADERQFFQELYGFEYDHTLHKHVLDTLVARMREMLGSAGGINRSRGELDLELDRPLILWDPRCERPLGDWILSTLAEGGPKTARETAALLGISLRAVQNVLKDLTHTGACVQFRDGRSLLYRVEDTTFSEPTQSRFMGLYSPS